MHGTLWLLALFACPRDIPDHLQLEPATPEADPASLADTAGIVAAIVGRDPLVRAPRLPPADVAAAVPGGEPIADAIRAIEAVERGASDPAASLQAVEERWRGTAAVPISRGYRAGMAEQRLLRAEGRDEPTEQLVLRLITPLRAPPTETAPVGPLAWLGPGDPRRLAATYAERRVMIGWLDGPGLPLAAVADALDAEMFDAVRQTAHGRLVHARGDGAAGPADAGLADLRRATHLALVQAAADRDAEQTAWAAARAEAATALGADDPVEHLLARATDGLTAAAGDDRAAGGALLALSAGRWLGACDTPPCGGIDRVEAMTAAGRFSPEIDALARVWRTIALKSALDGLDVGVDTVMFPRVLVDLTDALLGTGAGPLDTLTVRRKAEEPGLWLALGRSVGAEATTDRVQARAALGQHLAREARRAAETASPEDKPLLERIAQRATR